MFDLEEHATLSSKPNAHKTLSLIDVEKMLQYF